ncbi:MAG: hypothetical protein K9K40_08735 [Desulfotignum sp.]|nr:hypothetical protein [Desulfotignum sp.]
MKKTTLPEKHAEQLDETELIDIENHVPDLRKDLHLFDNYISNRTVKRSVRENTLSKQDLKRLAKLISDPFAISDVEEYGESDWIDFIDDLALRLKFIDYDTKGEYAGYTSHSPSFPDNYIEFNKEIYNAFVKKSLQEQEQMIFDTLVDSYSNSRNEFYSTRALSKLDRFSTWGCATGVMPFLDFGKIRRKIFDHLKHYTPGVWYSTASLIRRLKDLDPYFLIPKKPRYKYKHDEKKGRYCNFYETKYGGHEPTVKPMDPDAFERVEGRYIERFLEYIPLCMGYVELVYEKKQQADIFPSMGQVKGFKVTDRFIRFINGAVAEPKVTILPNHEIHIESASYPANMIHRLSPFGQMMSEDKICVMKLDQKRIIDFMVENDEFDVKKFLASISAAPLPQNIGTELSEWAGRSDVFVLYDTCGLLEGKSPPLFANDFLVKKITKDLCLISSPERVLEKLEIAARAPVEIRHATTKLSPPPKAITSRYLKQAAKKQKPVVKEQVVIKQKTFVTLYFQKGHILEIFTQALVKGKCPVEVDKERMTISYGSKDRKKVAAILKDLRKTYRIRIEEVLS